MTQTDTKSETPRNSRKFVSDWLWYSNKRETSGKPWPVEYQRDARHMCEDYAANITEQLTAAHALLERLAGYLEHQVSDRCPKCDQPEGAFANNIKKYQESERFNHPKSAQAPVVTERHRECAHSIYNCEWDSSTHEHEEVYMARVIAKHFPDPATEPTDKDEEIKALQQWKNEALAIFRVMPLDVIGEELGLKPGDTVADKIIPWIRQQKKTDWIERAAEEIARRYPEISIHASGSRPHIEAIITIHYKAREGKV